MLLIRRRERSVVCYTVAGGYVWVGYMAEAARHVDVSTRDPSPDESHLSRRCRGIKQSQFDERGRLAKRNEALSLMSGVLMHVNASAVGRGSCDRVSDKSLVLQAGHSGLLDRHSVFLSRSGCSNVHIAPARSTSIHIGDGGVSLPNRSSRRHGASQCAPSAFKNSGRHFGGLRSFFLSQTSVQDSVDVSAVPPADQDVGLCRLYFEGHPNSAFSRSAMPPYEFNAYLVAF